jgi:hypothetical protein
MFILKLQPLDLKHPQIRLKNSQAKYVIKIPVFQKLKKKETDTESPPWKALGAAMSAAQSVTQLAGCLSHHAP